MRNSITIRMQKLTQYMSSLSTKWVTLVIGWLQAISTGSIMAIAACAEDIRITFDMTEKQYGLIATLYLMGNQLCFLPGYFLDKYGPILVSATSLIKKYIIL